MKRVLLVLAVVLLVVTIGCTQAASPPTETPTDNPNNGVDEPSDSSSGDSTNVVLPADTPPEDVTWISPGKVNIANFYPGARAEYPVTIHNGNDYECSFLVSYRYPDHVADGYSKPQSEAQDWVMVVDTTPVLAPYETRSILVVLAIPENAVVAEDNWEFWISVKDASQGGMIQTELCCRWLISMRS